MRSRAVSLPALCSRSRRSAPPPASVSSEIRRSSSLRSRRLSSGINLGLGSDNGSSLGRGFLWRKNTHGEMRGDPSGAEKKHDTEGQSHDEDGRKSGSKNHFHRNGFRPP